MFNDNLTEYLGYPVRLFSPDEDHDFATTVYRIAYSWDTEIEFKELLKQYLEAEGVDQAPALVIGLWCEDPDSSEPAIKTLVDNRHKLPNLKGLFFGDVTQEECEVSWMEQSDITSIFTAFPALEHFTVRGGEGLSLAPIRHLTLKSLTIQAGGIDKNIVDSITKSVLPELEHLEIYLGTEQYGANSKIGNVRPLLTDTIFPKLKYLGLKDSDLQDAIAHEAANSPVVKTLEELDLSLGVMTDEGGAALLAGESIKSLKKLNLKYHFMSDAMMAQLEALPIEVDVSDQQQEEDEDFRWVAVGE